MIALFLFFCLLSADNIEIRADKLKAIQCPGWRMPVHITPGFNWVKLSHTAVYQLKLQAIEGDTIVLYDRTVYFEQPRIPKVLYVDYEKKHLGLATFVYPLICFCAAFGLAGGYFFMRRLGGSSFCVRGSEQPKEPCLFYL